MPQPTQPQSSNKEGRILLAIQALNERQFKSVRAAALSYDVPRKTLSNRMNGITSRRDCTPNSHSRGFPPRPQAVQEMANLLLSERGESPVGINWTTTFIKRRTELKAKFSRKYDYKRAKCEDPKIIQEWFSLVRNIIAKYNILEQDIYNFDEAGFAMGVIATAKVVTSSEAKSRPKTIQPGNREWVSIIQGINSYGWALPPFIIFKAQNHLSAWYEDSGLPDDWLEFLSAFKEAFKATFTEQNIKSGFRATGLVPYEPQNVLSYLNLYLRTPTPPIVESNNWTSKTPQTIRELDFQTEHVKNRIIQHQNSSPTSINDALSRLAKGAQVMMHSAVLLKAEVKALQAANEQKKRRERKRKRRIMQGGSLTVREGEDILQSAEVDAQVRTEVASETARQVGSTGRQRRCGRCEKIGHNALFESLASYAKDAKLRGFYPALIDRSVEIDP
ncbi:hypothetical protein V491_03425 [Pseudogymnoascus sp. VKM F-3775]|nr:hypothetical protein V491_03425 [Pseudogymnoascus sp. VKM F-3775]